MIRKTLMALTSAFIFSNANAGAIDFRIGEDIAELTYLSQVSSFGYGGADIGVGGLINDRDDIVGTASILVSGNTAGAIKGLHFGIGAKAFLATLDGGNNAEDAKGGALTLGGKVRYVFPGRLPVAVLGEAFYAPAITSFSDFDSLFEIRFALELEVTPSARAYIGYRNLEVGFENTDKDYEIDDTVHIGVRFEF